MENSKTHSIFLQKAYAAETETIFNLFKNAAVFKLTGADEIQIDFETGRPFCLTFNNRGIIYGHFINISGNDIVMEWNVEGFQRPKEEKTLVEISLRRDNKQCVLTLSHKNIAHAEASAAKQKAWTEIFNEMEKEIQLNN